MQFYGTSKQFDNKEQRTQETNVGVGHAWERMTIALSHKNIKK